MATVSNSFPAPIKCGHTFFDHLFNDPFCKKTSTLEKVAIFATHFFTACIPLALYQAAKWAISRFKTNTLSHEALIGIRQKEIPSYYSEAAKEAIAFARRELTTKTKPISYSKEFGPVNKEIEYLVGLLADSEDKLFSLLERLKTDTNPWGHQEVIQAADSALKIAFAVSALTLEDLSPFIERERQGDRGEISKVIALINVNFYQFRTYFVLPKLYHDIRGEAKWREGGGREPGLRVHLGVATQEHQEFRAPFYQQGKIQNQWRELFNEFCALVPRFVSLTDVDAETKQYSSWTKQDIEAKFFHPIRDTLPWQ